MIQKIVVSGILIDESGKVLLAKRPMSKKIAPGKLHLPGGHVEFGESMEEALVREFQEEFCLDVKVGEIVSVFNYVIGEAHTIGATFILSNVNPLSDIKYNKEDNEEIVWIGESEVDEYLKEDDHNKKIILKYFNKLKH